MMHVLFNVSVYSNKPNKTDYTELISLSAPPAHFRMLVMIVLFVENLLRARNCISHTADTHGFCSGPWDTQPFGWMSPVHREWRQGEWVSRESSPRLDSCLESGL
jgi:hypothetical protein